MSGMWRCRRTENLSPQAFFLHRDMIRLKIEEVALQKETDKNSLDRLVDVRMELADLSGGNS